MKSNLFRQFQKDDGVTLVEIAVALAILGMVIITFFSSHSTSVMGTIKADKKTASVNLARLVIEELKAKAADPNFVKANPNPQIFAVTTKQQLNPTTSYLLNITPLNDAETKNIYIIKAIIYNSTQSQPITISTLLYWGI